jgi:predicted nucleic acid-binding protein
LADRVFVDTNVLVYADDDGATAKRDRARALIEELSASRQMVVSTQVLQEYFAAATRKLGLPPERARSRIELLTRLDVVLIRPDVVLRAIDLHRLRSVSFWDALILSAAAVAGCARLLTEDMEARSVIDGVRIENPFAGVG